MEQTAKAPIERTDDHERGGELQLQDHQMVQTSAAFHMTRPPSMNTISTINAQLSSLQAIGEDPYQISHMLLHAQKADQVHINIIYIYFRESSNHIQLIMRIYIVILLFIKNNSDDEFHVEQQQQQPQRQQNADSRSSSCLEEVVMSCTSSGSKQVRTVNLLKFKFHFFYKKKELYIFVSLILFL